MADKNPDEELVNGLLFPALDLEGRIVAAGQTNRDASKIAYGVARLDARLALMATLAHVIAAKSGQPGESDESRSRRLILLMAFTQGTAVTESLVSEGQYSKAAAALKQDYEMIARLGEIRAGTARAGVTPQVKHAASGSQWMYGELNKMAHPSNEQMLAEHLARLEKGEVRGVSHVPTVIPDTARGLYDCHLFTLVEAIHEAVLLFYEMYPQEEARLRDALRTFEFAAAHLELAGFSVKAR